MKFDGIILTGQVQRWITDALLRLGFYRSFSGIRHDTGTGRSEKNRWEC